MNDQTTMCSNTNGVTKSPMAPQEAMVQLHSWMIPAEASSGTFITLSGACGKTTTKHLTCSNSAGGNFFLNIYM